MLKHSVCLSVPSWSNVGGVLKHSACLSVSGWSSVMHAETQHVPPSPMLEHVGRMLKQSVPLSPKLEQRGTRDEAHNTCLSVPSRSNVGRTLKHTARASQSQFGAIWDAS